jgi:hypothetical protein
MLADGLLIIVSTARFLVHCSDTPLGVATLRLL